MKGVQAVARRDQGRVAPHEADTVVVVVVGGITCSEIQAIRDHATATRKRVVVIATSIATADNILEFILPP